MKSICLDFFFLRRAVALALVFFCLISNSVTGNELLSREERVAKNKKRKSFGLGASYAFNYDTIEPVKEKTVGHQIGIYANYFLNRNWILSSSVAVFHNSFDLKVYKQSANEKYHQISDIGIGASHSKRNINKFIARISDRFSILLPTSEGSRIDQRRFLVSFSNTIATQSWKRFSFFNTLAASFASHRLRFSIVNDDVLNRDLALTESVGLNYQIFSWLGVSAGAYFNLFRFLDKSWERGFGNSVTLFSRWGHLGVFASYFNNSFSELDNYRLDYFDPYQRVIQAGLSYDF